MILQLNVYIFFRICNTTAITFVRILIKLIGVIMVLKYYSNLKSESIPSNPKNNSSSSHLNSKKKPYSPPKLIPLGSMK